MSIFKPNLDRYTSARFVAPVDDYELEVTSVRPRQQEIKKGGRAGQKMNILTVNTKIVTAANSGTEYTDKLVSFDFIINAEDDSFNRALRFAANCLGFQAGGPDAEKYDREFIERYGDADWSVDFEGGKVGAAWESLAKARVNVVTKMGGNTEYPRADIASSRPI